MAGMKSLKKQRRIQIIVIAFVALFGAAFAFWMAAPGAFQYFRSPTQIVDHPPPPNEVFRLGGLVTKGSLKRGQGKTVHFEVTDTHATVPVVYTGILPDLFGEGQGMVGTGRWVNGEFVATLILAKHDANYMPKEVIDALKAQGVYVAPNGTTPGS